jgi:hypothetical protein
LNAEVPEGWEKRIDRTVGALKMAEFYPAGADDQWAQKLSIEALSGEDLPDPILFVEGLAEQQSLVCDEFTHNSVYSGFENGYPTAVHMLQCGKNKRTGRAIITMVKVIKGNTSLYTITRIWRLPAASPPMQEGTLNIDQNEIAGWSQILRQVITCDPALAAHPCPVKGLE